MYVFFSKTVLFISLSLLLSIQTAFSQGKAISFSKEQKVEGISDSELLLRVKKSLNTSFLESNLELLTVDEVENKGLSGTSSVSFAAKDAQLRTVASGDIAFIFEVTISMGVVELTLSNWVHVPNTSKYAFGQLTVDVECPKKVSGTMKKSRINVWTGLKTVAEETANALLDNFVESLSEAADGNTSVVAQKFATGVPTDIKTVGIIILKHEMVEIEEKINESNSDKLKNKNKERHNKMASTANSKLSGVLATFPYKYVVATNRTELNALYKEGYTYVLDCKAYDNMKNGNFKSSAKVEYFYELYIRDLSNNVNYVLTKKLSERSVYNYNLMINKFLVKGIEAEKK